MRTHERHEKEIASVKAKKNQRSKAFNGEPKEPINVESHQRREAGNNATARISFLIDFSLTEGEIRGKITHRLTDKQEEFMGLDQTVITQFMKKYLSRLEKSIVRAPVEEPYPQIHELVEEQGEKVTRTSPGEMHTRSFGIIPAGATHSTGLLQRGQPFRIQWSFEPPSISDMEGSQLNYKVIVFRKKLAGGVRELVGEIDGQIVFGENLIATIPSEALPSGAYRLEANSNFSLKSKKPEWRSACQESCLIQVI
jgi:hypothetical protein